MRNIKKLYCYVDETGQDSGSDIFIVVAVISTENQDYIRNELLHLESKSRLYARKWFSSRSPAKETFLSLVIKEHLPEHGVYYSKFKKPAPFFSSMAKTIEKVIKQKVQIQDYKAIIYVDGIDKKKAVILTSVLRGKGIRLKFVRSVRDESEPIIRLADRWAGCIRDALDGKEPFAKILSKAEKDHYIKTL